MNDSTGRKFTRLRNIWLLPKIVTRNSFLVQYWSSSNYLFYLAKFVALYSINLCKETVFHNSFGCIIIFWQFWPTIIGFVTNNNEGIFFHILFKIFMFSYSFVVVCGISFSNSPPQTSPRFQIKYFSSNYSFWTQLKIFFCLFWSA